MSQLQPRGLVVDSRLADPNEELPPYLQSSAGRPVPEIICPMPSEPSAQALPLVAGYLFKPVTKESLTETLRALPSQIASILIVDNDEDVLRLFRQYLTDLPTRPYRITTARSGHEALQVLEVARPDLIFLDLVMPMMDGYQFIDQLKARGEDGVRIIVVSGQDVSSSDLEIDGKLVVRLPEKLGVDGLLRGLSGLIQGLDQGPGEGSPWPEPKAVPRA